MPPLGAALGAGAGVSVPGQTSAWRASPSVAVPACGHCALGFFHVGRCLTGADLSLGRGRQRGRRCLLDRPVKGLGRRPPSPPARSPAETAAVAAAEPSVVEHATRFLDPVPFGTLEKVPGNTTSPVRRHRQADATLRPGYGPGTVTVGHERGGVGPGSWSCSRGGGDLRYWRQSPPGRSEPPLATDHSRRRAHDRRLVSLIAGHFGTSKTLTFRGALTGPGPFSARGCGGRGLGPRRGLGRGRGAPLAHAADRFPLASCAGRGRMPAVEGGELALDEGTAPPAGVQRPPSAFGAGHFLGLRVSFPSGAWPVTAFLPRERTPANCGRMLAEVCLSSNQPFAPRRE
jgi:hypothetical protein